MSASACPRVVLIHATALAMAPIAAAFARGWPEAELANVLDDSLSVDRSRDVALTPAMTARFEALGDYASTIGARGVLFTCSAFGSAIEAVARRLAIPVLKPNEAMFEAAFAHGRRIGMVGTFGPSMASMGAEFDEAAGRLAPGTTLRDVLSTEARDALDRGDVERHHVLVAEAAATLGDVDAVMLAHFSTAGAVDAVRARVAVPVLTAPDAAVARIRTLLTG